MIFFHFNFYSHLLDIRQLRNGLEKRAGVHSCIGGAAVKQCNHIVYSDGVIAGGGQPLF